MKPVHPSAFGTHRWQTGQAGALQQRLVAWLRWGSSCLLALAGLLGATSSWAADAHAPETLARVRSAMDGWFQARGLAHAFELQKLRWGPRADDPAAQWLKLELRFLTEGTDQDHEDQRFAATLQQFQPSNDRSLAEALFFKLVHLADIPREDARITVAVLGDTFAVARERASGRLRFEPTSDRLARRAVQLPDLVDAVPAQRLRANVPGVIQASVLPDRVQRFLQDFFAHRNSEAHLPAPRLALKPLEPDYVGMEVAGIRRIVITGGDFWERLHVSIELRDTAQGRRAVCYLDGGYAPGLGLRLPAADGYTDMSNKHQADLDRFADELMRGLQDHLARDGR